MRDMNLLLRDAFNTVVAHLDRPELQNITEDTNVFGIIDSFAVVDLMLETEMMLEAETGTYVTLADETMFDGDKSPLLRWSNWVSYVEARYATSN
jgi:hypothetical protein